MKILLSGACVFVLGAVSGAASVHTAYTAPAVTNIQAQGEPLYSDADRRALRSIVKAVRARR